MLETINDQTGIKPPQWLARLGPEQQELPAQNQMVAGGKKGQVNGTH